MTTKPKKQKSNHPWRVWVPAKDKPKDELTKGEKIPLRYRMGVRL